MRFVRQHNHRHTCLPLSKVNCQALFKLSTCPLRPLACTDAPPLTPWEQRTATSTYPSTAVRSSLCTHNPLPIFMPCDKTFLYFYPAPDSPSGVLQGVLLTLSMCLLLLALLVLVLWLHHTGQDGRLRKGRGDKDEFYNEIRYTPSLMKRSFV